MQARFVSLGRKVRKGSAVAAIAALALAVTSCSTTEEKTPTPGGSSGSSGSTTEPPRTTTSLFNASITKVAIEIAYGPGAEPFDGNVKDFGPLWNLFRGNALAVFDGKKAVSFPEKRSGMAALADLPAKSYSNKDLTDVAATYRKGVTEGDTASFFIVFVDGYWVDDGGVQHDDVLCTSVGETGVIGMFKPAINGVNGASPQLVEQLALVHAFGHAVGFVDNGVPVGDNNKGHIDAEGHHCTNKQCAMAGAVETAAGAAAYASSLIRSPDAVLIGQECLSDARVLENLSMEK